MGFLEWIFGGGRTTTPTLPPKRGVWAFPDQKKRDEDGYYPIICPYCLDTFHIWEAEFRSVAPAGVAASTASVQSQSVQQDDNWGRERRGISNESNLNPFEGLENLNTLGENNQNANGGESSFPLEVDEKYDSFERRFGGQQSTISRGKVLRIFDERGKPTGEVTHITLMDRQQGGNDKDGIRIPIEGRSASDFEKAPIMSVINKYGQLCKERICPHCHHRVSDFVGIWPSYTVALIGDTKVGKTVYLHKLGAALSSKGILGGSLLGSEANPDYKSWIRTAMEMDQKAQDNEAMTDLTTIQFMPPNIINFLKRQRRDGFILNLFDFPGEALSKPINKDDGSMDEFKAHYLPNIDRMDAFMLLFDAVSFQTVRSVFESDPELKKYVADRQNSVTPVELLNYFEREYLAAYGNQFTKPLAIIVSKSDLIKLARDKDGDYFPDLPADQRFLDQNPSANRDKKKVDLDDLHQCNVEIETFLHEDEDDQNLYERGSLDQVQGESCWFALSSKGDATNVAANPIRVTEPMEWILWRLGLVEGEGTQIPGGGDPISLK